MIHNLLFIQDQKLKSDRVDYEEEAAPHIGTIFVILTYMPFLCLCQFYAFCHFISIFTYFACI
jgi:hypothetical protein